MTSLTPFATDVAAVELTADPPAPETILAGTPQISSRTLWECGEIAVGVWEITPGVVSDTEVDEIFLVIHGRATVQIDGGDTLELYAGSVGALAAGARTTWTVTETLRKLYTIKT